jgi:hypothetical protein
MKTVTILFRAGLVFLILWFLLRLLLDVTNWMGYDEAYYILNYELYLGFLVIFLKVALEFCFTSSTFLFMYIVIEGWEKGKKAITFEFEQETKDKHNNNYATEPNDFSRGRAKVGRLSKKP